MEKKLVFNINVAETRVALLERGRVAEYYVERHHRRGIVGNIYKGKVSRVLPGMQSAFINIGGDRSAFLFGGDVLTQIDGQITINKKVAHHIERKSSFPIEKALSLGQEIMIQVAKEPLGEKGPRVTMLVAIPGRYLVLMPEFETIGISRRISSESGRKRLYDSIERIKPENMGIIARTAAMDVSQDALEKDLLYLKNVWKTIEVKEKKSTAPTLLYQEPDIILKTARDLYSDDVSEIIVDDRQAFDQLQHFLVDTIPGSRDKLKLYDELQPIFDFYGIEMEIATALSKKVWLPSGGHIVIEKTEALTAFDINTGKFVGTKNARETIFKTNIEAVDEIVVQLKIRNIGGIIIIDFIDMEYEDDRDRLYQKLVDGLRNDKARTNVLPISELGLIQMTRKRTRESLEGILKNECPLCKGAKLIESTETSVYEMIRDIERFSAFQQEKSMIQVKAREDIFDWLIHQEHQLFENIKANHNVQFLKIPYHQDSVKLPPYEVIRP